MSATFIHHDLRLLNPSFDSPLVDVLTELEHLRKLRISGTTPKPIFFQLKHLFHVLESLGSARIEGNHTTLADYIDSRITDGGGSGSDHLREIANIEKAMDFVDQAVQSAQPLREQLVRELHALTVANLIREGDPTPGSYRTRRVEIRGAEHLPPEHIQVPQYMSELVDFINRPDPTKYDLMKVALAHHRFGWIHPFTNGNGRVVRLLTYALLLKYGFAVGTIGRVLNPTAVFCNDREKYYRMLARADRGDDEGLTEWCLYVLSGILTELRKLEQLTDYRYLRKNILMPALVMARSRDLITTEEATILKLAIDSDDGALRSRDVADVLPDLTDNQRAYRIRGLVQSNMLQPVREGSRQYTLCFASSRLIRVVIPQLISEGFVPDTLTAAPAVV